MLPDAVTRAAAALLERCKAKGLMIVTAESCTGGLIAGALTEIAGSSAVVERGFVTYSNAAKQEMLGVPAAYFPTPGAVSAETAKAMAAGALARSRADLAVAVTGVAGPGGGSAEKPVGLVWFAVCRRGGQPLAEQRIFTGDRSAIRQATVLQAFALLEGLLE